MNANRLVIHPEISQCSSRVDVILKGQQYGLGSGSKIRFRVYVNVRREDERSEARRTELRGDYVR